MVCFCFKTKIFAMTKFAAATFAGFSTLQLSLLIPVTSFSPPYLFGKNFVTRSSTINLKKTYLQQSSEGNNENPFSSIIGLFGDKKADSKAKRQNLARTLLLSLIEEDNCYCTETGARAFADICATNIVYEDCYEPQPIVGRTVS